MSRDWLKINCRIRLDIIFVLFRILAGILSGPGELENLRLSIRFAIPSLVTKMRGICGKSLGGKDGTSVEGSCVNIDEKWEFMISAESVAETAEPSGLVNGKF